MLKKDEIMQLVKDAITQGKYKDGQKLVENKLCEDFGVGRNIIREALKQLNHEGFIKIVPFQGAFVSELTTKDIAQIYDILGVLEGLSMRIATPTITDEEIENISLLIEKVEQNQNNKFTLYESNLKFHQYMTELGKNQRLISFTEILRQQARRMSLASFYLPEQIAASILEHRNILEAIKERKPSEVERLIVEHYIVSRDLLIKALIYS